MTRGDRHDLRHRLNMRELTIVVFSIEFAENRLELAEDCSVLVCQTTIVWAQRRRWNQRLLICRCVMVFEHGTDCDRPVSKSPS